jgi:hypothetical protein
MLGLHREKARVTRVRPCGGAACIKLDTHDTRIFALWLHPAPSNAHRQRLRAYRHSGKSLLVTRPRWAMAQAISIIRGGGDGATDGSLCLRQQGDESRDAMVLRPRAALLSVFGRHDGPTVTVEV